VINLRWIATQRRTVQRRSPVQQRLCNSHQVIICCTIQTAGRRLLLLLLDACLLLPRLWRLWLGSWLLPFVRPHHWRYTGLMLGFIHEQQHRPHQLRVKRHVD
jgi:hypothetical protein